MEYTLRRLPQQQSIYLAFVLPHGISRHLLFLAPVAAGLLVSLTGYSIFDPLIAGGVAMWTEAMQTSTSGSSSQSAQRNSGTSSPSSPTSPI